MDDVSRQIAYILASGAAFAAVVAGTRLHRHIRWPWRAMAAAVVCSCAANTIWAADLAAGQPIAMRVSAVDILYLSMYVLLMIGLLTLPGDRIASRWSGVT